jgi:lipid A 3-O-deacylase
MKNFLFFLVLTPATLMAQKPHYIRFLIENDVFQLRQADQTDRYFTNGAYIEFMNESLKKIPTSKFLISLNTPTQELYGLSIGQEMYTPTDIKIPYIIQGDRPYAGWLFVSHSLVSTDAAKSRKMTSSLQLGLMGPGSFAEETQTAVHRLIKSPKPMGWDNQIKSDIGINYYAKFETRMIPQLHKNFDVFQSVEGHVGTVTNFIGFGGTLRVGQFNDYFQNATGLYDKNVQIATERQKVNVELYQKDDFSKKIQSQVDLGDIITKASNRSFQCFFFITPAFRAVLDNSFLQGGWINSSKASYRLSPDKLERFYVNMDFGGVVSYGKFQVVFTQAFRTAEFKNAVPQQWGKLSLTQGF